MEEIKLGEYIRTRKGISKIIDIELIDYNGRIYYEVDQNGTISPNYKFADLVCKDDILKHSDNLIELIEVGDYVNGELIDFVVKDKDGRTNFIIRDNILFFNKYNNITSIVTKEQFEAMKYKVKENNNG